MCPLALLSRLPGIEVTGAVGHAGCSRQSQNVIYTRTAEMAQ